MGRNMALHVVWPRGGKWASGGRRRVAGPNAREGVGLMLERE